MVVLLDDPVLLFDFQVEVIQQENRTVFLPVSPLAFIFFGWFVREGIARPDLPVRVWILVTGGAGYIGSVAVEERMNRFTLCSTMDSRRLRPASTFSPRYMNGCSIDSPTWE